MVGSDFFDIRMRGFRDRADVDVAVQMISQRVSCLPSEKICVAAGIWRVLAREIVAPISIPPFDRAAMDGYAIVAEDTFGTAPYNPLSIRVIGDARPGRPFSGQIASGNAVRIMTGSRIPQGCNAVLPVEFANEVDGVLSVVEPLSPGKHIGRTGEDVGAGSTVLSPGRCLRPQDLGILTALGVPVVDVTCRPRVEIIVTGDELLPAGSRPAGSRIVDSNTVMLRSLIERDGGQVSDSKMVTDDRELIRHALKNSDADVLLISGGSSVGVDDHAPSLVAELGELAIHGVALRPASPAGIGFIGEKVVFLLPGNPVSCLCAYDLFAGRAIRILGGRNPDLPYMKERIPLAAKVSSAIGRVDYVRVRIRDGQADPLAISGASMLSTTTLSDGFLLVPRDSEGYAPGEIVTVYRYDGPP